MAESHYGQDTRLGSADRCRSCASILTTIRCRWPSAVMGWGSDDATRVIISELAVHISPKGETCYLTQKARGRERRRLPFDWAAGNRKRRRRPPRKPLRRTPSGRRATISVRTSCCSWRWGETRQKPSRSMRRLSTRQRDKFVFVWDSTASRRTARQSGMPPVFVVDMERVLRFATAS